ncbi:hypothetical protein [Ileibacterium valens]|uniref:hypothetical protein n=1 Tax=Ileibacterium valens TaxID=1862668 RepID=UPI0024BB0186|nr:hypothetical protein [Ileibacterium valens]
MSPSQEMYSEFIQVLSKAYPGKVWDGWLIVPESTPYPFIQVGDTLENIDFGVKTFGFGKMNIVIHIWHNNPQKRGDLSCLMFSIRKIASRINQTKNYGWCLSGCEEQVLPDTTTKELLMHGVLSFDFKYWRR